MNTTNLTINYLNHIISVQEQVEKMIQEFNIENAIIFCLRNMNEKLASSFLYGLLLRYYYKYIPQELMNRNHEAILPPYRGIDKYCSIQQQYINRFKLIDYYRQISYRNKKLLKNRK
jgi:hypothetical protein